jgi:transcription-repair coupling factor (superfamily II helicase)
MDRLLCGDVGYGKTEVALRAAMKCILDGKQAALLCPPPCWPASTIRRPCSAFSASRHGYRASQPLPDRAELKKTLRTCEGGKCDLVIGTHRLLQKDVKFKDLGLLIVDEEQRFGVTHKERIKEMSRGVDVLTLSATPIPRTLNMALSGIRDMSTIEEPPQDRCRCRPSSSSTTGASSARRHPPGAGSGAGRCITSTTASIDRKDRQKAARAFGRGREHRRRPRADGQGADLRRHGAHVATASTQILVCTTIIETGIDIPNVNTLIIEDADRMGLAQLHQIRGRVGRSTRRAYAYLTFRRDKVLTEMQEKRLSAIREFAEFGSGFKIAMRDLEIRGAGNLLGAEQSGHMMTWATTCI